MARLSETYRKALAIHRCPDGYEGPCWGPTQADFDRARQSEQEADDAD